MRTPSIRNSPPSNASAPSRGSFVWFVAASAGIALLSFVYYAYAWGSIPNFKAAIDTCGEPFCDFADYYYPMGDAIFETAFPVPGYVYSPFIAILLAVFQPLGLDASLALWGILQVVSVILYLFLFRRLVPAGLPVQLLFVGLALTSFPLLHNLSWGQVGIFTTVAILGMLVLLQRGQRVTAAALFAFAASFKFFPLIFIAPFAARREARFLLLAAIACGAFLLVVPVLLLGIGDTLSFYGGLLNSYRDMSWVVSNSNSQHFPHVILRLVNATGHDASTYLPLLRGVSYSVAIANLGLITLIQRAHLRHADLWSFHILFLSIPFVLKTSWPVDLVFISFAQAFLAWQILEGERPDLESEAVGEHPDLWKKQKSRGSVAATLFLLLTSMVLSNIITFNLIANRQLYGFMGFIFWTDLFCLIATYIVLLPSAVRQIRHTH